MQQFDPKRQPPADPLQKAAPTRPLKPSPLLAGDFNSHLQTRPAMTSILNTRFLGQTLGRTEDGVTQYLGVKYANLKHRLADAELIENRVGDGLDATKDGPTAVSRPSSWDLELSTIQHSLPKKVLSQSDIDCLNLNIAMPAGTSPSSKLPVFVFIPDGGFTMGANSLPQYDLKHFVALSVEKKLPVVAVSINYRLGAFGFLTSLELRKAGYHGNNGLRDQRVALKWIKRHIQDFSGDPSYVTLAGRASVTYLLDDVERLFQAAVLMSGSFFLTPPQSDEEHDLNYLKAMKALDLMDATPEERIKVLLERPAQDIVSQLPSSILTAPRVDEELVHPKPSFADVDNPGSFVPQGKLWCPHLMVGNAQMDSTIFRLLNPSLKTNAAKRFTDTLRTVLSEHPNEADYILKSYNITPDTPDEPAFTSILAYINDIAFLAPTLCLARGWTNGAFVYYFNEGNPWDGPIKGHATYNLDVAYLFQNFREFLSPAQQEVAAAFAEDVLKFCYARPAWPAVKFGEIETGFSARVYGPSEQGLAAGLVQQPYGVESTQRDVLFKCGNEVSFDDLMEVFWAFKDSSSC
ncbi:carboxylesterase [Penicillium riverlandense]|uniref:carboxylesterase n=1 Tax=Penicillium riverlandense TaxID=1903569 RepID=UPI002547554A|nr:carboxylesterase [Penicillium riverlandense]KAJ5812667.1 carboxylesterase [Penicillium riverlandense]